MRMTVIGTHNPRALTFDVVSSGQDCQYRNRVHTNGSVDMSEWRCEEIADDDSARHCLHERPCEHMQAVFPELPTLTYTWEDIDALLDHYDTPDNRALICVLRDALWNNPDCAGYRRMRMKQWKEERNG